MAGSGGMEIRMGVRALLIAISGKEPATIHKELGVVPTQEFWETAESPFNGAILSSGSYLLYINDKQTIVPNDALFSRLSKGAKLLACYVNETSMQSLATSWENGANKWWVLHDACNNWNEHIETKGEVPSEFVSIRDRRLEQWQRSRDADYVFDVPIELVKGLGGFSCYDDFNEGDAKPFQVLQRV